MDAASIKKQLRENEAEINRLNMRIEGTVRRRSRSKRDHDEWAAACAEFHARYDELAFPGGYERARQKIDEGDPEAIETAICFLELRPYFFRSGYMFKDLLRRTKRARLTPEQGARVEVILRNYAEFRASKKNKNMTPNNALEADREA